MAQILLTITGKETGIDESVNKAIGSITRLAEAVQNAKTSMSGANSIEDGLNRIGVAASKITNIGEAGDRLVRFLNGVTRSTTGFVNAAKTINESSASINQAIQSIGTSAGSATGLDTAGGGITRFMRGVSTAAPRFIAASGEINAATQSIETAMATLVNASNVATGMDTAARNVLRFGNNLKKSATMIVEASGTINTNAQEITGSMNTLGGAATATDPLSEASRRISRFSSNVQKAAPAIATSMATIRQSLAQPMSGMAALPTVPTTSTKATVTGTNQVSAATKDANTNLQKFLNALGTDSEKAHAAFSGATKVSSGTAFGFAKALDGIVGHVTSMTRGLNILGSSVRQLGQALQNAGMTMTLFISIPIQRFITNLATSIVELDQQMIEVSKTTELLGESTSGTKGSLDTLTASIMQMARRTTPTAAVELAKLAAEAGRAGIIMRIAGESATDYEKRAQDMAMGFVRAADMMVNATDVSVEKASEFFGQMVSIFPDQKLAEKFQNLGSVINSLGQVISRGEQDIIDAMLRAAPAFNAFNTPVEQVAALSAALVQLSASPERAGTALASFVEQFIEQMDKIAPSMGTTVSDLKKRLDTDLVGTLMDFINRVRGITTAANRAEYLETIFGDKGPIEVVQKFATSYEQVAALLKFGNKEFADGTSLANEFDRAMLGSANQLGLLKNAATDVGFAFRDTMLPLLRSFVQIAVPALNMVSDAIRNMSDADRLLLAKKIALLAIIGPVAVALGSVAFALGIATTAITSLIGGIAYSVTSIGILGRAILTLIVAVLGGAVALRDKFANALNFVAEYLTNLADKARSWGANFVGQLAAGILDGAAAVINAVSYIASIISSFFEPGSPPETGPLSTIDRWGTGLMRVFLNGFKNTDFSVLSDIANTIKDLLARAVNLGQISPTDLIEFVQAARQELAALIDEFNRTGIIAQEKLNNITKGLGDMAADVQKLIILQLKLNKVLNDIKDIDKRRKAIRKSVAEQIRAVMLMQGLTAKERAARISAILADQRKQESGLNKERDALNDKRDSLQEELDKQKGIVDVFREQVSLQKELAAAIDKMNQSSDDAKKKKETEIPKLPKAPEVDGTKTVGEFISATTKGLLDFEKRLNNGERAVRAFIAAVRGGWDELVKGGFVIPGAPIETTLDDIGQKAIAMGLRIHNAIEKVRGIIDKLKNKIDEIKTEIKAFGFAFRESFETGNKLSGNNKLYAFFSNLGIAAKKAKDFLLGLSNSIKTNSGWIAEFKKNLPTIIAVFLGLSSAFLLFGSIAKSILGQSAIGKFFTQLLFGTKTVKGFGAAANALTLPLKIAGFAINEVAGFFRLLFVNTGLLKYTIRNFGKILVTSLGFLPGLVKPFIGVMDKVGLSITKLFTTGKGLKGFFGVFKGLLGGGLKGGLSFIVNILSKIPTLLAGLSGGGLSGIFSIIKALATFAGKISLVGIIITAVIAIFTGFFKFIIDNFDYVKKQVAAFFTNLLAGMGGVEGLKARFAGIFESLKKIFGFFAAIGYAIASVFFALLPTIGAVIGFIINLVLGFVDIILTAVGGIIDIISSIFNAFKTGDWGKVWTTIQSVFSDIVGKIGGLLSPIWDAIVGFFKNTDWGQVWQGIKDGISNAFKGIGNFISGLFGGKKGAAGGPKVMASLALDDDPFTKAFKNIQKIIGGFLSPIRDTIVNFFKNIDWAKVWSSITTALSNVAKTIGNFLTPIWNSIVTFFNSIDWGKVWQGILTALGTVIGIIWSLMSFIPSILIGIFNTIDWGAVWNSIVTFFNSIDWGAIWNGITTALSSVVGTIGTFLTPIWDTIVTFFNGIDWNKIWEDVKGAIGDTFKVIGDFISGLFLVIFGGRSKPGEQVTDSMITGAKIGTLITNIFQDVPQLIQDIFGKFITWLTEPDGLVDKVLQAFSTIKTNVINTVHEMLYGENGIITKFTDAFNQIKKVIITSIIDGANGFIGAIESGVNSVIDAINSLIEGANKLLRDLHLPEMSTIAHVVLGRIPIPEFAKGGLVMNPTLGLLGEAGPELVIPLSSFFKNLNQGQQLQPQWIVNVNNPQVRDDRDIDRIVQRVSVAIGRRSNRLGRIGV